MFLSFSKFLSCVFGSISNVQSKFLIHCYYCAHFFEHFSNIVCFFGLCIFMGNFFQPLSNFANFCEFFFLFFVFNFGPDSYFPCLFLVTGYQFCRPIRAQPRLSLRFLARMHSGLLRVARSGSGAKAPPLAARRIAGTPTPFYYIALLQRITCP